MTKPTDAELLAEWDRVSHIADAGQRRLACLRAVIAKWGAPPAVAGPVVNRATVIEWLDANDIEVTDRQMDGLFHFATPTTQPAPILGCPPLPDFDTVEQHIYGACRRYITQDMLEPIHNLIRETVDADRVARAPADSGDVEDAARWRELREQHESDEALCCVFAPNDMRECLVPVGSLPGELDAFMDAERAARKQGANHD